MKHLDHLYSSLDPDEGFYWIYEQAGLVERVVSPAEIERLLHEPPQDTRAYTRARLLRLAGVERTGYVDWDFISVKGPGQWGWASQRSLDLPDPAGFTKALAGPVLDSGRSLAAVLDDLAAITNPRQHPYPQSERTTAHAISQALS
jgi:Pup amidohydrolase